MAGNKLIMVLADQGCEERPSQCPGFPLSKQFWMIMDVTKPSLAGCATELSYLFGKLAGAQILR